MADDKKPALDTTKTNPRKRGISDRIAKTSKTQKSGAGCRHIPAYPKPTFHKAPCEKVIQNQYNAWIVLGRDRPGGKKSGYGGLGDTDCASIDIVVGRPVIMKKNNQPTKVHPTFRPVINAEGEEVPFASDSARIYISEKTKLYENFGLSSHPSEGTKRWHTPTKPHGAQPRSGIGIKADHVAIMGQEGIRLVTRPDTHNSMGSPIDTVPGIDFIAGGGKLGTESLEPLVKGDRLVECIQEIFKHLEILEGDLLGVIVAQLKMNAAIAMHTHASPFFGINSAPSLEVANLGLTTNFRLGTVSAKSAISQTASIKGKTMYYTSPMGGRYINSLHVHTT